MIGPGDQRAPAGRGHLRASQTAREQVIDVLKAAFVQGRLAKDEFDLRVGQALASRTYADLAALTADIPAGLTDDLSPRKPARESVNKKAVAALTCATVAPVGMWRVATMIPDGLAVPVTVVFALCVAGVLLGWPVLLLIWLDTRAGRQSGRGRPPAAGQQPGRVRDDPALPGAVPDQTRVDLRIHRSVQGRRRSAGRGARTPRGIRPVADAG